MCVLSVYACQTVLSLLRFLSVSHHRQRIASIISRFGNDIVVVTFIFTTPARSRNGNKTSHQPRIVHAPRAAPTTHRRAPQHTGTHRKPAQAIRNSHYLRRTRGAATTRRRDSTRHHAPAPAHSHRAAHPRRRRQPSRETATTSDALVARRRDAARCRTAPNWRARGSVKHVWVLSGGGRMNGCGRGAAVNVPPETLQVRFFSKCVALPVCFPLGAQHDHAARTRSAPIPPGW